jgi:hypothetical protein
MCAVCKRRRKDPNNEFHRVGSKPPLGDSDTDADSSPEDLESSLYCSNTKLLLPYPLARSRNSGTCLPGGHALSLEVWFNDLWWLHTLLFNSRSVLSRIVRLEHQTQNMKISKAFTYPRHCVHYVRINSARFWSDNSYNLKLFKRVRYMRIYLSHCKWWNARFPAFECTWCFRSTCSRVKEVIKRHSFKLSFNDA